jgi:K+-sensing histidine kinase KdpD
LTIRVPPERLRLAVRSLLEHALAASPAGSTVAISAEGQSGGVSWSIEDGGPVVPTKARTAVLTDDADPAAYGRPTTASLFVARALAASLGGRLELDESPTGRNRTRLVIPLEPSV